MRTFPPIQERLTARLIKPSIYACWEWQGYVVPAGYGSIQWNGRPWLAHRVAFLLSGAKLEPGQWVLHHCDNRRCCNPGHLYAGTVVENNRDMRTRGRARYPQGETHGRARLTPAQVLEIRTATGPLLKIAQRYGIGKRAVKKIRARERWKHLS